MRPDLLSSPDPAIRSLAGDEDADPVRSPLVQALLEFPDAHPYKKWWGTHWRLVALADLGVPPGTRGLSAGIEAELDWLATPEHRSGVPVLDGLARCHASQEGNAIYACAVLGFASDPKVAMLAEWLMEWQWPDGGWNCDPNASGRRSSFHESVTPALGLVAFHEATGSAEALSAAERTAELLLSHRLFRSAGTGGVIHPSWTKLHYPAYWHYDLLQGLRLLDRVSRLGDPRAQDALDLLEESRRRDGRFSGPAWSSKQQPDAVDWGRGSDNEMLNLRAEAILHAAGRA